MAEVGKTFDLEEQKAINGTLNDAEDKLATDSLEELRIHLEKVEGAANRITASMLATA